MKNAFLRSLAVVCLLSLTAADLFGGVLKSEVIAASGTKTFTISDGALLKIRSFTQSGGTTRGIVSVMIGSGTTDVLSAAIIDNDSMVPVEPQNEVIIAGPATVTVTAGDVAACITYKKDKNSSD